VRLNDLEGMDQIEAAKKMEISQPTFHRLVVCARKKIADAIVNGKAIKVEGGNIKIIGSGRGKRSMGSARHSIDPARRCVCPKCGHRKIKERGIRCANEKCPECGNIMIRSD
jgi:hypothetical protein